MNFLNRFKSARDSYVITVLVIVIVLMVNFIASKHFFRLDMTQNQIYALSDATKNIVRELDDIVSVKVYFSEKLPPNLFVVRQYVDDILTELESYSRGNLSVEFLNPSDPEVANEAIQMGIPQIRMNTIEKDKLEVKNGYLGVAIIYGDHIEILPVVKDLLNVEYDLIASIKKVTATEEKTVAFVTGHNEPTIEDQIDVGDPGETYSFLRRALERNYSVREVDLLVENSLEGVDTLIIAGSQTSFAKEEKYQLDQFLMTGKNVIMLLDAMKVSNGLKVEVLDLKLDDFLEHYGFRIEKQFVLDRFNETANFNQGFVNFITPYPFWIKAVNENFDSLSPIVNQLDSVVLPWTSSLTAIPKEGIEPIAMVLSTQEAWTQTEPFNLDPGLIQNFNEKAQFALAALLTGEFESFYNDDETIQSEDHLERSLKPGHLFVVGNSRFITNKFVQQFQQNMPFIMNAVDFLTLDESLISIRSKTSFDLPLKNLSIQQRQLIKFVGILLMPILVVSYGIGSYFYRKKKKYVLRERRNIK